MNQMPAEVASRLIAGALFDFVGYLTTRERHIVVGSRHEAPLLHEVMIAWAKERGLSLDGAEIMTWHKQLQDAMAPKPSNGIALENDLVEVIERHGLGERAHMPSFMVAMYMRSAAELLVLVLSENRSFQQQGLSPMMAPRERDGEKSNG